MRKIALLVLLLATTTQVAGCVAVGHTLCWPNCSSRSQNASSLVSFLYPNGAALPDQNSVPELRIPLRVGLAFLPSSRADVGQLDPVLQEELLERVRRHFMDRKFISEITIIPAYYLRDSKGYDGLAGVQRLYGVDVMALVSYDQVMHESDNEWSLAYLTIVGAYVVRGSRHDVTTLVDLAVVDAESRSLILRAGGTDTRHGNTTLIASEVEQRQSSNDGFSAATDRMVEHFDEALGQFQAQIRDGTSRVRVADKSGKVLNGGGACGTPKLHSWRCWSVCAFESGAPRAGRSTDSGS